MILELRIAVFQVVGFKASETIAVGSGNVLLMDSMR